MAMGEFRMPALGADMESGTVTHWLVKPGDHVDRGTIVAEVETDKATIEVEVFESGTVDRLLVPEGERVPVGTPLAVLTTSEATAPPPAPVAAATAPMPVLSDAVVAAPTNGAAAFASTPARVQASPLARRLADLLHVDLGSVHGTGPGGAVTKSDVQLAAAQAETTTAVPAAPAPVVAAAPAPATAVEAPAALRAGERSPADRMEAMRLAVGALMARSKREVPHYYLGHHIDMTAALTWLEETNLSRSVADRLVPAVLLLRAVALAARKVPEVNGFWTDGAFHPADGVHVGVAVSVRGGGLIAPAIHDCDAKGLDELMRDLRGLVQRARDGVLRSSEMSDPTLTVTNLGDQGVETVYGVIYAPQVALVGFGRIVERPWASHGMVGARRIVHATLSADHRVSDGHRGARFLAAVDALLQEPEKL